MPVLSSLLLNLIPKPKPDVSVSNKNQDDEIKKQLLILKLQNGKLKKTIREESRQKK
ncbi:hypothetical protein [Candidatus Phytoplasma australiense]|uniref:Uncharacterized protein n=1 Tax=Strawberry lethal yellows phytoplasma (CPA) str. NZSb11 TaxID=980422 RepID=R4S1A2_PHYAS|nr:hypothetical protein [Candidatus Phytoplasma australiense]AGL90538.1 Hypothetical Protein SLY_0622 [Strawberry lethal yellows phytoplasma (CPA) str. NZSb11]AGL90614.1 Hypothetical Protein SLY_0699 [Strawberry lethal yellows phytoplasma (CPA) str. NZSb11]AGL90879.1 Hypothetical Protein SLY_0965 [Strawberry lethal yellows phytoplasma (CPA) str. NZSb11]